MSDTNSRNFKELIELLSAKTLEAKDNVTQEAESTTEDTKKKIRQEEEEVELKLFKEEKALKKEIRKKVKEETKNLKSNRELREKYAKYTLRFVIVFNILYFAGFVVAGIIETHLSPSVLMTLAGAIPSSMALFGWVIRGLFPSSESSNDSND